MQILEHILEIRREKEKHEFSQTIGNHLALRNFLFALRNLKCGFRIAKFRIAKFPNGFSHCQMVFRIAKWFFALPNGFSHCQMDFRIAKWFFALRNLLWFFALRNFALRNSQHIANSLRKFSLFCPPILFCA